MLASRPHLRPDRGGGSFWRVEPFRKGMSGCPVGGGAGRTVRHCWWEEMKQVVDPGFFKKGRGANHHPVGAGSEPRDHLFCPLPGRPRTPGPGGVPPSDTGSPGGVWVSLTPKPEPRKIKRACKRAPRPAHVPSPPQPHTSLLQLVRWLLILLRGPLTPRTWCPGL